MHRSLGYLLPLLALSAVCHAQNAKGNQPMPQYYVGVAVEGCSGMLALHLKLLPNQGLIVLQVIPNSPAAAAQLQPNDILIKLNDIPLTSQNQLVSLTNPEWADGQWTSKQVNIEFIRGGDHHVITMTPVPRPENLLASGPPTKGNINSPTEDKTLADASGQLHQIGTGVIVDPRNTNAVLARSISSVTRKNQTIILSQEADASGHVKNTITAIPGDGSTPHTYPVEPAHLDKIPADLRDLVSLFPPSAASEPAADPQTQQIQQLQEKLDKQARELELMRRQLQKLNAPAPTP